MAQQGQWALLWGRGEAAGSVGAPLGQRGGCRVSGKTVGLVLSGAYVGSVEVELIVLFSILVNNAAVCGLLTKCSVCVCVCVRPINQMPSRCEAY